MPKDETLPHKIDPFRSAIHATQMHGYLSVSDMQRLKSSLSSDQGRVDVGLAFSKDEDGICILKGSIKTTLVLQCQRCMESYNYAIMSDFTSGIAHDEEEAQRMFKSYDPIIADQGMLVIQDVIEDELLVNLPIVPMHDQMMCHVKLPLESGETLKSDNPFNVISILRSKDKKD